MTTPDLRPIATLTPEILSSSSHWFFIDATGRGYLDASLRIRFARLPGYTVTLSDGGALCTSGTCCYPCTLQPDGRVVHEPWPMAEGEEIIDDLEGIDPNKYDVCLSPDTETWTVYEGRMGWLSCGYRPGYHPAPRKGEKWVWEADKC